jgi:hypothetical protein
VNRDDLEDGLLIAFSYNIRAGDINSHTFQVLVHHEEEGLICWCELPAKHIRGVKLELTEGPNGTCVIEGIEQAHPNPNEWVNGALFRPNEIPLGTLRIVLKGDLIQDEQGQGVDANHLPPWLPNRPSGDGVEGGTFESWLIVEAESKPETSY